MSRAEAERREAAKHLLAVSEWGGICFSEGYFEERADGFTWSYDGVAWPARDPSLVASTEQQCRSSDAPQRPKWWMP